MIEEKELITLLIGLGALFFTFLKRHELRSLPASGTLVAGFAALVAAWTATVLEVLFWTAQLNMVEHVCYAVSACLMALWSWRVFISRTGQQP
jgi:hypothetical protein